MIFFTAAGALEKFPTRGFLTLTLTIPWGPFSACDRMQLTLRLATCIGGAIVVIVALFMVGRVA